MSSSASLVTITPGGQLHVADPELVAEHERGHVVLDLGRELTRQALDRERVHELLEHAALRDTFGLAEQVQAHLGLNRLVGAHPHEVDVDERALHGVALHLAGERELVLAVDLERDQRVGTGLARRGCCRAGARSP